MTTTEDQASGQEQVLDLSEILDEGALAGLVAETEALVDRIATLTQENGRLEMELALADQYAKIRKRLVEEFPEYGSGLADELLRDL